ncbi:MAG TPA: YbjN domain-containing protein [Rectinemataceae bacterium]|nr:YbjN domain-containing protein [Rectinemataceae bacterium]
MAGLNKIEEYLIDLGVSYEEPQPGTWLVEDSAKGIPSIFVSFADPVVIIHARVMDAPQKDREAFFAELLKLNYEGLLHGAYALEGDEVVLLDTLEYADMDKTEFEASLDALSFALSEHYPLLSRFMGN